MPENDELKEMVERHDHELDDRTGDIVKLEGRVRELEEDVKKLALLFNYIREFTLGRPGKEGIAEMFNREYAPLMQRYQISYPIKEE